MYYAMRETLGKTIPAFYESRAFERPDGYYWQSNRAAREYGPYATMYEAVAEMQRCGESSYAAGDRLDKANAQQH